MSQCQKVLPKFHSSSNLELSNLAFVGDDTTCFSSRKYMCSANDSNVCESDRTMNRIFPIMLLSRKCATLRGEMLTLQAIFSLSNIEVSGPSPPMSYIIMVSSYITFWVLQYVYAEVTLQRLAITIFFLSPNLVSLHTHTHTRTHARTHTYTHTNTNTYAHTHTHTHTCLLYTSPSPRDMYKSRMPSSA